MAIGFIDKYSDLSGKTDFIIPPVSRGILGWGYLGGSMQRSLQNLARGNPGLNVVGAPTLHDNYASFVGSNHYFQTAIFQRMQHTIFCVARSLDTFVDNSHKPMIFSSFNGQNTSAPAYATQGLSLYVENSGYPPPVGKLTGIVGAYDPNAPGPATATTVQIERDMSQFSIMSLTQSASTIQVRDWTLGYTAINPIPAGRVIAPSNRAFAIGSPANPISYTGTVDIAGWAIYEGVLNELEHSLVVAKFRSYYAKRGMAV